MLLYTLGCVLQWMAGHTLFYYGAFLSFALIFSLLTPARLALPRLWYRRRLPGGGSSIIRRHPTSPPRIDSPRNLLIRTFISYTHPLFPWLLFFTVGIVIGRHLHHFAAIRQRLMLWSGGTLVATYLINTIFVGNISTTNQERLIATVLSTRPYDRGLLYSIGTLASSVLALCILSILVGSLGENLVTNTLARAGQMSLSIYHGPHLLFQSHRASSALGECDRTRHGTWLGTRVLPDGHST